MATESVAAREQASGTGLRRDVGFIGLFMSSEGSIIGSGWLFAALGAALIAGSAAIISWILAGIAVIIIALVYAELGAMYPVAGGAGRFPHYAFGSVAGISFGFFAWLQAASVAPIEVLAVEGYASYWWPALIHSSGPSTGLITPLGYLVAVVLMAAFTAINFLGVKWLAHTNSAITWWKIAIPVLAIIILFTKFHTANFTAAGGFMPTGMKGVFSAIASGGIVFAYLGFEQADQLAGEARNPQRNIPRAIIGAVLVGVVIYCLLEVVFIGALPGSQLLHGFANIPDKNIINGPFAGLAGIVGLGWLAFLLRVDAVISPSGTGLIYNTSTSRLSYGLAKNRYYPQIFDRTDKRGVPWFGLIFAFAVGLVFFLPFPSWYKLVSLVTAASVLMYAGAPLAMGAFRMQVPDAKRPYRLPGAAVLAPIAFIVSNLIIYWTGWDTLWKLGIVVVLGYVLIGAAMIFDSERPKLQWKSAVWLPVYLIGMGVISYLGTFGGGRGTIAFGFLDTGIVVLFSVGIYYWALATRLPDAEMQELVARQAMPEAETAEAA
ncbi:MAG TPA: APC family permease [Streptosporangiaceae bacterium]|nr:APC family permease [Streptosporangiaceae bacterium]